MSAGAKFALAFFAGIALVYLVNRFPLPGALIAGAVVLIAIVAAARQR
ncbi:MAG: hypothetical protein K8F92_21100 [Hyphomicrobium sp.]|nr:hypothetical protein [Hyphomicrobium sp.]